MLCIVPQAALIADVFGACPRGGVGAPSPVDVPSHYDVRAAVFSDREATSSSLVLEVKKASFFCFFLVSVFFVQSLLSNISMSHGHMAQQLRHARHTSIPPHKTPFDTACLTAVCTYSCNWYTTKCESYQQWRMVNRARNCGFNMFTQPLKIEN